MEPNIIFVNEPVYIRESDVDQLADEIYDFYIEDSSNSEDEESGNYTYCIMSIDVGILHLGISVTTLDEEYNMIDIIWIDLINITQFTHKSVSKEDCPLYHTKTFCDWIAHVIQDNREFFDMADHILIERQPPSGLVGIEQIIFAAYRNKTILVHPRCMHAYFGIECYEYDQRKVHVEKIAKETITDIKMLEQMKYYDRVHDICDSICLMLFWINKKHIEYSNEKLRKRVMSSVMNVSNDGKCMTTEEWFDKHKYKA